MSIVNDEVLKSCYSKEQLSNIHATEQRLDKLLRATVNARQQLEVAKSTRKFAPLRDYLLKVCELLERRVPYMPNRDRVIKHAPEVLDDACVHIAYLESELETIYQQAHIRAAAVQDLQTPQEYKDIPWVVVGAAVAAVAVVTKMMGLW